MDETTSWADEGKQPIAGEIICSTSFFLARF